jgi:hypothetical protein
LQLGDGFSKSIRLNGCTQNAHHHGLVIVQVVDRGQAMTEDFVALVQVLE